MAIFVPDWPGLPAEICAISTTRQDGASGAPYDDGCGGGGLNLGLHVGDARDCVLRNRQQLRTLVPAEPAWLTQIHGALVRDAANVTEAPEADASITARRGVVCAVLAADCLPVLFCDTAGKVVGAAHAGWRGLAAGVLEATVAAMRLAGAEEILAWLGPAIGPQRFEVGAEVREVYVSLHQHNAQAFVTMDGDKHKYLADIYQLARLSLGRIGVRHIAGGDVCTVSAPNDFYSFRRDGCTGRMASLIWIK